MKYVFFATLVLPIVWFTGFKSHAPTAPPTSDTDAYLGAVYRLTLTIAPHGECEAAGWPDTEECTLAARTTLVVMSRMGEKRKKEKP